ncbi:serine hydrolase domain-containing protein [Neolewinella agarilytica]|uniref:CubicO group peptidase, beta-lactamase class C family n=1 Tax=Neolewinella agarilytica TaxID=478744 RepID=A0A1H9DL76_9BACT|nr:serine hydrolase [Neolewinella agarilytica]SEQ14260.1 CubicO group peptidase, beta-lactamase class C family [Neolewinella agarilytica]
MLKHLIFPGLLFLSGCHVPRFFTRNFANITDHKIFPYTEVNTGDNIYQFPYSEREPLANMTLTEKGEKLPLTEWLDEKTSTTAFLVIQHDSILYEQYFDGYTPDKISTIFSVSKSITSLLTGIAVDEGKIEDINDPVTKYIPELLEGDPRFQRLTIRHLLDMRSGLDYKESYSNPFADMAKLYYGTNQLRQLSKLGFSHEPGTYHRYQSGTTALLGIVVERATGTELGKYLEAKVWQPMGMEFPATWSLDDKRHRSAKSYSGLNTTARDLAKIGALYANNGRWRGRQIVSPEWVKASITPDMGNDAYQYQWYSVTETHKGDDGKTMYFPDSLAAAAANAEMDNDNSFILASNRYPGKWYLESTNGAFYAQGILNQFIYVDPAKELVIVRQGRKWDNGYLWLFEVIREKME